MPSGRAFPSEGCFPGGGIGRDQVGVEIGLFLQLRHPGLHEVDLAAGVIGGPAWGTSSDGAHLAYTQIDLELGIALGAVHGLHLALSGSKALDPWLAGPRCVPFDNNRGCVYAHSPLSAVRLHPRAWGVVTGDGWVWGGDLALTMGWLPEYYLL